jgi:hypothetical protein
MTLGPASNKRKPKNKPVLTDANKPVIDALRDNLQGTKIWICKNDTLEVNRKPLEGFVCTPCEGVTPEEHVRILTSAIESLLEGTKEADTVMAVVFPEEEVNELVEESEQDNPVHFIYPNLSDRDMWRSVVHFEMPSEFINRLSKQYSITKVLASIWVSDYFKFMYIKALQPTSLPSENIGKVLRLHLQYTKSYGALCGILENRIAYEPIDRVSTAEQHTEYAKTLNRLHAEFGTDANNKSWNGQESMIVEKSVDPTRFWIIKKFWK